MARYSFFTTEGPDKGKTFELQPGVTFIGRRDTPGSDEPAGSLRWILTDPAVSRTHARIDWDGRQAPILIHLSSTNATLLDGRIVTGQSITDGPALASGNRLRMGQTTFQMEEVESVEAEAEAEVLEVFEEEAEQSVELAEAEEAEVAEVAEEREEHSETLVAVASEVASAEAVEETEPSELAAKHSRWYLQQRGSEAAEFDLQDEAEYRLDGLTFNCAEAGVEVALAQEETEAYLLRLVDGQYWTTSLKPERSITLKNHDIVRTEQGKFELLERF